jgi:hypothetical protein
VSHIEQNSRQGILAAIHLVLAFVEGDAMSIEARHTANLAVALAAVLLFGGCGTTKAASEGPPNSAALDAKPAEGTSGALIAEGQRVFRFDTFGHEQLWFDKLRLNEVVEQNVDPTTWVRTNIDAGELERRYLSQWPGPRVRAWGCMRVAYATGHDLGHGLGAASTGTARLLFGGG